MGSKRAWYITGAVVVAGVVLAAVAVPQQRESLGSQASQLLSAQTSSSGAQGVQQPSRRVYTAVRTAPVLSGSIAQTLSYTGDVRAKTQIAVVPKTAGRIEELEVDVGDRVQAGQRLAVLEHDVLDAQVQQAQAGLALARARLAGLEVGPRAEAVAQAEANVRLAEARLAALKAGPASAQVEAAEAAVRAARNQVFSIEANADSLLNMRGSGFTEDMKEAQVGVAYEQVKQAEAQLAALTAPPTREQLDQAEAAVDAARQQLSLAQNPYTDSDLEAARAAVSQAQASVQLAAIQQRNATVEAPMSGVVSERFVSVGDMAAPTAPLITIISDGVEVQVAVEEAMLSQVSPGRPVSITVAAYPDSSFSGSVATVSPSVDLRTRSLMAKIQVDDSESRLRPGMFAQVSIVAASRENALLIPRKAVLERNRRQIVFLAVDDTAVMREIETGLSDGKNVEVVSGLRSGDEIILNNLSDLVDGDPIQVQGSGQ